MTSLLLAGEPLERKRKTDGEGSPPKVQCEAPEKKLKTDEEGSPPKEGATENTEEEKGPSSDLYEFGFKQLKKRLNGLDVKPVKVKAVDTHTFAFATFRNEEERDDAIKKIKGHVWKDRTLDAKLASAAADPFQKIRSKDNRAEKSAKQIAEEQLPVGERLKNSVTPLWNVPYEEQLKTKFEEIEEALKNVATQVLKNIHFDKTNTDLKDWITAQRKLYNGKCCELLPIKPSPVKEGYRNKCEFTIGKDVNGQEKTVGFRFGMYKDGTNSVGEPYDLLIIPDTMKKVVKCFQDYIRSRPLTSYDPEHHQGYWRLLTVRSCLLGDLMLTVDFHPQQLTKAAIDEEKNKLQEFFTSGDGKGCKVSSIYWRTYSSVQTGSHEAEYEHVIGSKYIEEKLFDLKFRVSPDAFFQVNTLGAEVLYSQVADWCNASPTTTVLDICCGTDSGATISVINEQLLRRAFYKKELPVITTTDLHEIRGVCNTVHNVQGKIDLDIDVNGLVMPFSFYILRDVGFHLILGQDFLTTHKANIDFSNGCVSFHNDFTIAALESGKNLERYFIANTNKTLTLKAYTENDIQLSINKFPTNTTVLLEPHDNLINRQILGSNCLSVVKNAKVYYRVLNPTNEDIVIKANSPISKVWKSPTKPICALDNKSKSDVQFQDPIKEALNLNVTIDSDNITKEQHQKLLKLIGSNRNVFAKDASELGKTDLHYHNIETTNEAPVRSKRFQYSPKMQEIMETQIKNLKENDIIEESMSPYHSSVILVKKPNNTYRFVLDFRKLNEVTKKVSFSIPKIEEVVDTVGYSRAKIFSSLDLASGFHQVPLDEQSKHKTAFMTPQGQYQFKRLCFGLTNAPATFQMLMTKVLQELNWKKDVKFDWTTKQDDAFNTLKQKLTSAPILAFPDFEKEFFLSIDASDSAIGYVLGQKHHEGLEKVIAYGGRGLRDQEKRWHINHKEGLALIEAIKTFKPYIANNQFTVYTDSITVRWLNNSKDATGRLGRWSLFLQQYTFNIVHRPGTQNQNADALSRRDYPIDSQDKEYQSDDDLPEIGSLHAERKEHIAVTFEFGWENNIRIPEVLAIEEDQPKDPDEMLPTRQTLYQLQRNCPDFKPIFDYKLKGLVPDEAQKARSLVAKAYHYEIIEGIFVPYGFRKFKKTSSRPQFRKTTLCSSCPTT
ncbi:TRMT2A [Mytilus edulis]|uniref:tRNA (uracil(54)-C(5))-methyltransferase n=1 Tax=Mytilus edulis TaxID=6550 RepID=A0A8S3PNK2_MYTED|nr:TRMT2A [Mytilus edulis]